jgi:hypothetical protein
MQAPLAARPSASPHRILTDNGEERLQITGEPLAACSAVTGPPRTPGTGPPVARLAVTDLARHRVAAGIIVIAWPGPSLVTLALVLGIWLIIYGIMEITPAFRVRSAISHVQHIVTSPA